MFRSLRSCFGKFVTLILLVLAAYAGWRWGPMVFPKVQEWIGLTSIEEAEDTGATPELADSVVGRVLAFRRGEAGERMALSGPELTSVLRYSVPGLIPDGASDPVIRLERGSVRLQADVAISAFPDLPDLGPVLGILPDTLSVEVEATLIPFQDEQVALMVQGLEAGRIPLPGRLIPEILNAMGRVAHPGLPPEALLVPLPPGLGSAYLLDDSLILSTGS